ncbi:hypothetical protein T492DRAFT_889080 [Pavlovales sp. CCMP2436]|nr:hypothetical protein T492DRAFT_889080 [Pavlovales sp. CCMP2436]
MQETQGTQGTHDGRGFFALSSQGGARPVEHKDHPGLLSELGGDTFNSVTGALAYSISTEVSVAGLAAGDEASAALAGAHAGETSLAGLATGDEASALAEAGPVETSAAGLATVGHEASALAGAHASETSLMGLATGDEASALAEAGPVETSAAGLAAVGHEASALAGVHAGEIPVVGLAAGDEASTLAVERPVARGKRASSVAYQDGSLASERGLERKSDAPAQMSAKDALKRALGPVARVRRAPDARVGAVRERA